MGVKIYYLILAAILLLGLTMPQQGRRRKKYIVLMALLHIFVCGWRYEHLTGDLMKYHWGYLQLPKYSWFSPEVLQGGRNTGFFLLQKLFSTLTNGNFQIFLIFIAIVTELAVAVVIYRYSPRPWLSYLVWNCFGFYIFGFSAIKQALAMSLLLFAFSGIMEDRPKRFLFWTLLAGTIHVPALIFLPAYWLAHRRVTSATILGYVITAAVVYLFRTQIVTFFSQFYYDETEFSYLEGVGGRFVLILLFLFAGLLLKGRNGRRFVRVFNLIAAAAILQLFATFDNVFTRLTDYYFQLLILYFPMLVTDFEEDTLGVPGGFRIHVSRKEGALVLCAAVLFSGWYYNVTCLRGARTMSEEQWNSVDNSLNYRFSWEVSDARREEDEEYYKRQFLEPEDDENSEDGEPTDGTEQTDGGADGADQRDSSGV